MTASIRLYLSVAIGIMAIGLGFYGAFFLPVKTSIQWIFIVLLLITGIVSLSVLWLGSARSGQAQMLFDNKYIKANNAFAVLVFLCLLLFKGFEPPAQQATLTIHLSDWKGTSILASEANAIKVIAGSFTKIYSLSPESEISLPYTTDLDSVQIEVLHDDWQLKDSQHKSAWYSIPPNNRIELSLIPAKERCCLKGRVEFEDNKAHDLANITVQAEGISTKTQADGSYRLELPTEKQLQDGITVIAKVGNFQGQILCNSISPCDILLTQHLK